MRTREAFIAALRVYTTRYAIEQAFVPEFIALLEHERAFHRDHLPGHITASAWITDPTRAFVLLTHHAKLRRWLQPGGHADGQQDVLGVALREMEEETGVKTAQVVRDGIFDIDIHAIPARKDFPGHLHYDVRFLFEASRDTPLTITEESIGLAWTPIDDLATITGNNRSMLRMAEKAATLR